MFNNTIVGNSLGWMMIEKDFKTLQLIYMYIYILSLGKKLLKAAGNLVRNHWDLTCAILVLHLVPK